MSKLLLCVVVVWAFVLGVAGSATAAPIYLRYASMVAAASGDVSGVAFSNANWMLEFQVEQTTPDSEGGFTEFGNFVGAVTGGQLRINSTDYTLAGPSASGSVVLTFTATYDAARVNIGPNLGFVQMLTGPGTIFPALFDDNNDLGTANLGTTVFDITTDEEENPSQLGLASCLDSPMFEDPVPCLLTMSGATINITQAFAAGAGALSLTVSDTSAFSEVNEVPEPGTVLLLATGVMAIGAGEYRRRRRRLRLPVSLN